MNLCPKCKAKKVPVDSELHTEANGLLKCDECGAKFARMITKHPTTVIGRNDPCPCGSGLKYKFCCIS